MSVFGDALEIPAEVFKSKIINDQPKKEEHQGELTPTSADQPLIVDETEVKEQGMDQQFGHLFDDETNGQGMDEMKAVVEEESKIQDKPTSILKTDNQQAQAGTKPITNPDKTKEEENEFPPLIPLPLAPILGGKAPMNKKKPKKKFKVAKHSKPKKVVRK